MALESSRHETFEVGNDHLVRKVVPPRGRPYEHRCPLAAYEQIAHAAEELGADGFTLKSLLKSEHEADRYVPFTNVAVALAFFKERGVVGTRFRRNYAATESAHLDAMIEYHALAAGVEND